MKQSTDSKLLLRVTLKIMFVTAVMVILIIVTQYSFRDKGTTEAIRVDLSDLPPGEYKIIRWQERPIVVLHRTKAMLTSFDSKEQSSPFLAVYQQSPDYSCPLEVVLPALNEPGGFKAVCSGTMYDFAGVPLPGQNARLNLERVSSAIEGSMLTIHGR